MKQSSSGRVLWLLSGVALGLAAAMFVMPVETTLGSALADRTAYGAGREPQRGDLAVISNVVFTEWGDGSRLVLQVAGLPGDRVQIRAGRLLINGRDMTEELGTKEELTGDMEPVTVKEGHMFLLSTEGGEHLDSRSEAIGQVAIADVWGRICYLREASGKEKRHGTEKAFG